MTQPELIAFRFTLLFIAVTALVPAGIWLHFSREAASWHRQATAAFDRDQAHRDHCIRRPTPPNYTLEEFSTLLDGCVKASPHPATMQSAISERESAHAIATGALLVLKIAPATIVLLFYLGRWAFTGRFRPLLPSRL